MQKYFTKLKSNSLLAIITINLLYFTACDLPKKPANGKEDEIFVIADSSDYYGLEANLLGVFGKLIYTPQPEAMFHLTRKNFSDLEKLKDKKNIVIVAPLNSNSDVAKYIKTILDSTVRALVDSGKEFVFNKYDLWAQNQLVMILTAPTSEELNKDILSKSENLVYYFQKLSNKRLKKSLYARRYEKKDIEGRLLKEYGWVIYVQADFFLALDRPGDNFVWLRRAPGSDMERWVFVHWIDNASPAMLDRDSIAAERNRITKKYYRTMNDSAYVQIVDDYLISSEVNFKDKYAIMTQGLWNMSDGSMGGPFVNYTFYDENTKRLYILDGSIYAPKYFKKKLIQQVDVLLQSFMTEAELSEDRKDELLDAVE